MLERRGGDRIPAFGGDWNYPQNSSEIFEILFGRTVYFTAPWGLEKRASSTGTLLLNSEIWMMKRALGRASVQRNGIFTPSATR